jgi:hypothetical protein
MKLMLVSVSLVAVMLAMMSGRAAFPIAETEIVANLCPKSYCEKRFDDMTMMMCGSVEKHTPAGQDYVFGAFHRREGTCLCPCNLPKYFP